MTVRLVKPRDPRKLPEFTLWRMTKDERVAEARTRIVPLDDGRPEIRLGSTSVARTGRWISCGPKCCATGATSASLAQMKLKEFAVRGWTVDPSAHLDAARHDEPPKPS